MKITRKWVTLLLALAPGIYLSSCGSGNRNNEPSDTLRTQSAPPADVQSSTSDQRNMGDSSASSGRMGSSTQPETKSSRGSTGTTSTTGSTGTTGASGSTGSSTGGTTGNNEATNATTGTGISGGSTGVNKTTVTKRSTTTAKRSKSARSFGKPYRSTTTRTYNKNRTETRTIRRSEKDHTTVDTTSSRLRRLGDTTTTRVKRFRDTTTKRMREFGDTASNRMRRFRDTASNRMDRFGDTTRSRIHRMEDTLSNRMDRMGNDQDTSMRNNETLGNVFDSTRGNKGNISGLRGRDRQGNFSDTTDPENRDSSRTTSTIDAGMGFSAHRFITNQLESNYGEVKMARMAIDRSRNNEIKRIARMLENDHNTVIRELQSLARNNNLSQDSLPTMEGRMGKQQMDQLQNSGGDEFDKLWAQQMLTNHEQKIQMFEQMQSNEQITDSNIKNWVVKTLPTLRKHRDELSRFSNRSPR